MDEFIKLPGGFFFGFHSNQAIHQINPRLCKSTMGDLWKSRRSYDHTATNWGVLLLVSTCPWIVSHCLPLSSVVSFPWRKNPGKLLWQQDPSSARGCRGWFAPITSPFCRKKHMGEKKESPRPQGSRASGWVPEKQHCNMARVRKNFGFNLIGNTSFGKPFKTTFQCVLPKVGVLGILFSWNGPILRQNGIFCTLTEQMLAGTSEINWICHSSGHFALTGYASWISKLLPFEVSSLNTWFLACVLYIYRISIAVCTNLLYSLCMSLNSPRMPSNHLGHHVSHRKRRRIWEQKVTSH